MISEIFLFNAVIKIYINFRSEYLFNFSKNPFIANCDLYELHSAQSTS